jgi:periplasmic divalent cation tolerance protein
LSETPLENHGLSILELTTTLPSRNEAERIAERLVGEGLAACVQIVGPILSVYFWRDSIQKDEEYSLRVKTSARKLGDLLAMIKAEHPYELPEIVWRQAHASAEYGRWVDER